MVVTPNNHLIGLKAHSKEGKHAGYWKPRWLPRTIEVINLRKESTTVNLLDWYNSLLHFKSYPYIHRKFSYHPLLKKSLFTVNGSQHKTTAGHNQREVNSLGEPSPNRCIYITAPTSLSQGYHEKNGGKWKSQNTRKSAGEQSLLEMDA